MSMPDRAVRRIPIAAPIFPVVMTVASVLQTFAYNGDPLPHLWRPLVITVNVLSTIENTYLGSELPLPDCEAWESKDGLVLQLVRWLTDPQ